MVIIQGLREFDQNRREPNGQERGKFSGNWIQIGVTERMEGA